MLSGVYFEHVTKTFFSHELFIWLSAMHFCMFICFDLSLTPYEVDAASHLAMLVIATAITCSFGW